MDEHNLFRACLAALEKMAKAGWSYIKLRTLVKYAVVLSREDVPLSKAKHRFNRVKMPKLNRHQYAKLRNVIREKGYVVEHDRVLLWKPKETEEDGCDYGVYESVGG